MFMYKQSSSGITSDSAAETVRSSGGRRATLSSSSSSSSTLYEVELHRGSRGFGFAIRGGKEFAGMPICVLNIATGGSADRDGRLRVSCEVLSLRSLFSYYTVVTRSLTFSEFSS